jgi:hypothetical protein
MAFLNKPAKIGNAKGIAKVEPKFPLNIFRKKKDLRPLAGA